MRDFLILLVLVVLITAFLRYPKPVQADEGVEVYSGVSVDDLDALLPETTAGWQRFVVRQQSFKWFAETCEAGNLPLPDSFRISRTVSEYGIVRLAGGSSYLSMVYPEDEYLLVDDFTHVNLSHDWLMSFGLYCVYTYPGVTVRLTCWDEWTYYACREDYNTLELPGGTVTPVLVHETRGLSRGHYRAEMRCEHGNTCDYGAVFVVAFQPIPYPRSIGGPSWIQRGR